MVLTAYVQAEEFYFAMATLTTVFLSKNRYMTIANSCLFHVSHTETPPNLYTIAVMANCNTSIASALRSTAHWA